MHVQRTNCYKKVNYRGDFSRFLLATIIRQLLKMIGLRMFAVFFILSAVDYAVALPNDTILIITPRCSDLTLKKPSIEIVTDLSITAYAQCKNAKVSFSSSDNVNFYLNGTYLKTSAKDICQFYKRQGANVYTVDVNVAWGEFGGTVRTHTEVNSVTCTFDDYGKKNTTEKVISESVLAPVEILRSMGSEDKNAFQLDIQNVLNKTIKGNIALGRVVSIAATGKGNGLRVISCTAIANTNDGKAVKSVILSGGCGNGRIYGKKEGFYTVGNIARSPFFNMFAIRNLANVKFECLATVCRTTCNGSGCDLEKQRRKRSSDEKIMIRSERIFVDNWTMNKY
ncbi:vitelline envelope sperm lysin receptor [Patella vulgata]|uniref:vitelline envelope sperm lysin receptor n=1 Tax=Patella vulgata TaxID=6465 RepID=UPI00218083F0|nr:vitelline envelope sperm lysin receptor [Patella vulgata]